jgi:hypothetical protein
MRYSRAACNRKQKLVSAKQEVGCYWNFYSQQLIQFSLQKWILINDVQSLWTSGYTHNNCKLHPTKYLLDTSDKNKEIQKYGSSLFCKESPAHLKKRKSFVVFPSHASLQSLYSAGVSRAGQDGKLGTHSTRAQCKPTRRRTCAEVATDLHGSCSWPATGILVPAMVSAAGISLGTHCADSVPR